ncbi:NUDIX hydrolase [bacterium]|nr:NUDIX hydrolase [candidate division CSSED10-310 bacterium]
MLDGFFRIEEVVLRHELFRGGMSPAITRLCVERGDAAAVLLHRPLDKSVLLVRQFRYPAWSGDGNGWLWEIVAGTVGKNDDPATVAQLEIKEEAGVRVLDIRHLLSFFMSPGGCSEKCHLYLAVTEEQESPSFPPGANGHFEDLEARWFPLTKAISMIANGSIMDAKTIIALQWLQAHLSRDHS